MKELKVLEDKVLKAAEENPSAKGVLKTLFPEAFPIEKPLSREDIEVQFDPHHKARLKAGRYAAGNIHFKTKGKPGYCWLYMVDGKIELRGEPWSKNVLVTTEDGTENGELYFVFPAEMAAKED